MPGRLVIHTSPQSVAADLDLGDVSFEFTPSYNIPPTTFIPALLQHRTYRLCRWGLVPSWGETKESPLSMFNTRIESISGKRYFAGLASSRRAIIPVNGFFEWTGSAKAKQPYYIKPLNDELLYCAGLFDVWKKEGEEIFSVSIITIPACEQVAAIHHRMPAVLGRDTIFDWLDGGFASDKLVSIAHAGELEIYPVDRSIGSPSYNHPSNIEPAVPDTLF